MPESSKEGFPVFFRIAISVKFSSTIRISYPLTTHPNQEVMNMSYIAPAVQAKFETLSIDLKNEILDRNVQINTIYDLINVLQEIVNEGQ